MTHEARTFLVMVFFALGAAAFLGAVACAPQHTLRDLECLGIKDC